MTDKERGDITQEELKRILDYNPDTGVFTWMESRRGVSSGMVAGTDHNEGYRQIMVKGKKKLAHRLAWLYVHGHFPENGTDHINGDKADNRICNLRKATGSENQANRGKSKKNTSGYKGVSWYKTYKKWKAEIKVNNKKKTLGYFNSPTEAHDAYKKAANEHFGEYANYG